MPSAWAASVIALWAFSIFLTFLVLGLYRQVAALSLSPARRAAQSQGLPLGTTAPSFSLPDQRGREISFPPEPDGLVSLLVFGSPTCAPCGSLAEELRSSPPVDARLVFVASEDQEANQEFAAEHEAWYPVLTDGEGHPIRGSYKVDSTPFVYVVDSENVIRARGIASTANGVQALRGAVGARKKHRVQFSARG